ncbi:protein MEI2-like 6 [Capsicum galapagoense]
MATLRRSLLNPQAPVYVPISHTNNTLLYPPPLFPSMPYHFFTPPPPPPPPSVLLPPPPPPPTVLLPPPSPPPPPPPSVVSARQEINVRRQPTVITRWVSSIPPRFRRGGRGFCPANNGKRGGFGRGSSSNEGSFRRRSIENNESRVVCYEKRPRINGLKKHEVIPINLRNKNNTSTSTVMIKNIPYHYSREMLMQFLDEHCYLENQKTRDSNGEKIVFAYDFLYLPMDFKNKRSKGYAFVNFTDHRTVRKFFWAFNDKLNVFPGSARRVEVVTAKIQGKEGLVNRFKETRFECESEGFLPVWFRPPRDGYGESVQMITVGKCKVTPSCSYILKKP